MSDRRVVTYPRPDGNSCGKADLSECECWVATHLWAYREFGIHPEGGPEGKNLPPLYRSPDGEWFRRIWEQLPSGAGLSTDRFVGVSPEEAIAWLTANKYTPPATTKGESDARAAQKQSL